MAPQTDEVDLGPWAAYSLGRHPYALLARHLDSWTSLQDSLTEFEPIYQHEDPPELEELDDALNFLSSRGRVDPAALNVILRRREEYAAISREIVEIAEGRPFDGEVVDIDSPVEPCFGTLGGMIRACDGLITGPDELRTWLRLGAAVGEYPLIINRGITARWQSLRECFEALLDSAHELARLVEYGFLSEIGPHLARLDPSVHPPPGELYIPPFGTHLRTVIELDAVIRHALRTQPPPEVWFDLDETRLIFFGVPYSVDRHLEGGGGHSPERRLSLPEAAILWVLAEKAGEAVLRRTIRDQGKIAPAHDRQSEYLSRMRKKLRPAVRAYFTAMGWELSEEARMCFIVSVEGGGPSAPYRLAMDKSRVRLPHHRPVWMKARSSDESSR